MFDITDKELVSIVIPVYNSGKSLDLTINSVLLQTYPFKEIIVVDDGSSDDSYEIALKYTNSIVKVVSQKNSGAAVARNTGYKLTKGQYIQFLDAGDLLSPEKIEKQVNALKDQPFKVAVCDYLMFQKKEELITPSYKDQRSFIYSTKDPVDFLVNLWGGRGSMNFIQTNSWLVPRILIEKAGIWRNYRCPDDDGEFFARVILASDGVIHVPEVYNYYHISPQTNFLSTNKYRKYLQNTLLTIDLKRKYLEQKGGHPLMKKAMASQYLRFAVDAHPAQKLLSAIALKRYYDLDQTADLPLLGGRSIELIKILFGWKAARWIRYHLREKK